jgi:SAM-dependent methyltransferase
MFPNGGALLEVGCAYGYFLEAARPWFKVAGIEISEAAVEACRRAGLDVEVGTIGAARLDEMGPFDVIVMLDVIEHLPDPKSDLDKLARALKPNGAIVLTTGDFSSLAARMMGRHWRLMTPPQHLWFFTPKSIAGLAKRSRLSVEKVSYPWKVVPLALIIYQLKRMFRGAGGGIPATFNAIGLPVNLFDAMRVVLRKPA